MSFLGPMNHQSIHNYYTMHITHSRLVTTAVSAIATLLFALALLPQSAFAAEFIGVDVRIEAPENTLVDTTVTIDATGCRVDAAGQTIEVEGPMAICALKNASEQAGLDLDLVDYGFGVFVNGIGEHVGDFSNYWGYYVDYESALVGVSEQELSSGQELLFSYGGFLSQTPLRIDVDRMHRRTGSGITVTVDWYNYDWEAFEGSFSSASAGTIVYYGDRAFPVDENGQVHITFDEPGEYEIYATSSGFTKSAVETVRIYERRTEKRKVSRTSRRKQVQRGVAYLEDQMNDKGRIDGSIMMTEWAAMALASAGETNKKMFDAVKRHNPKVANGTTELARHILALEAIGVDSRTYRDKDYVSRLKKTHYDMQFGSPALCTDDIFAGLALVSAYEPQWSLHLYDAVQGAQRCLNEDGGLGFAVGQESDTDTTAAYLMLTARLRGATDDLDALIGDSRKRAFQFLKNTQNPDGGWGYSAQSDSNSSSTSWVLQGLRSRLKKANKTTQNKNTGFNFLKETHDKSEGSYSYDTFGGQSAEVLNTSYAVMALSKAPLPVNIPAELD